jgi:hypothetical protein
MARPKKRDVGVSLSALSLRVAETSTMPTSLTSRAWSGEGKSPQAVVGRGEN